MLTRMYVDASVSHCISMCLISVWVLTHLPLRHRVAPWITEDNTVINLFRKIGSPVVIPLGISLVASFAWIEASAASVSPSIEAGRTHATVVKRVRANRAVKKHRKVVKRAVTKPDVTADTRPTDALATPAESTVASASYGLALKTSRVMTANVPQAVPAPTATYSPRPNPYLVNMQSTATASAAATSSTAVAPFPAQAVTGNLGKEAIGELRKVFPHIPFLDETILPRIKTVYPTGDKPLVVVTFKCPTELIGVDTPSSLILHNVVNGGMNVINRSNLLSFNLQQVCE
jgi:hypothetical protein